MAVWLCTFLDKAQLYVKADGSNDMRESYTHDMRGKVTGEGDGQMTHGVLWAGQAHSGA